MTERHRLEAEIDADRKEGLTVLAKKVLSDIRDGVDNRNSWIQAREKQKTELEALRVRALDAFDKGDKDELESVNSELVKYEIGKKWAYPKSPAPAKGYSKLRHVNYDGDDDDGRF